MKRAVKTKAAPARAEDALAYYAPAPVTARVMRAAAPVLAVDLMYAYYGTE